MKHVFRFFATRTNSGWELTEKDMHHMLQVCKVGSGDLFELANGEGWVARATIKTIDRKQVVFEIESESFKEAGENTISIMAPFLRPGVIDDVLPYLCELNVDHVILYARSKGELKKFGEKAETRWQRILVESFKQCKRSWLPTVHVCGSLSEALGHCSEGQGYVLDELCDSILSFSEDDVQGTVKVLVGNEAGLRDEEKDLAVQAGFKSIKIASHVLRARTAMIAAAALFENAKLNG